MPGGAYILELKAWGKDGEVVTKKKPLLILE
jgi:hypothetical protein